MIELIQGDCLEKMKDIPDKSVDMILCDPPYGTTVCKWDSVIPFELMWEQLNRIAKDSAAIVLFGSQPFTSALIVSNLKMFKYAWVWNKVRGSNFFAAKFQPLNNTEDICVFSKGGCNNGAKIPMSYYPLGVVSCEKKNKYGGGKVGEAHGSVEKKYIQKTTGYPYKIITFPFEQKTVHPTQKPIALMEYLIKTYTNEGELILDFTMGSGTTGVACANTGRKFIGIELDAGYFEIASRRVDEAYAMKPNSSLFRNNPKNFA